MRLNKNVRYKGIKRKRVSGRFYFTVSFSHKGVAHSFGLFKDERDAARSYDLYVIKNNIPRETNFFKKKLG